MCIRDSFCIVSEVLVARLTRWQLVFEDRYRLTHGPLRSSGDGRAATTSFLSSSSSSAGASVDAAPVASIWLARGAPRRWFDSADGFGVTAAPTSVGRVSYNVTTTSSSLAAGGSGVGGGGASRVATYSVRVTRVAAAATGGAPPAALWKLRWPGTIERPEAVEAVGCSVVQVDAAAGIVAVTAGGDVFSVRASYGV